jgi:ferredoxin
MRVEVDRRLCESNAVCTRIVPEVFEVGDDDVLHIVDEEPPEAVRDRVRAAVGRCPKGALRLTE